MYTEGGEYLPNLGTSLLKIRGGESDSDFDGSGSDEDFDDSDFGSDIDGMSDFDESLSSDSFTSRMLQHYKTTPPVTKAFLTASFALTFYGYITGGGYPAFATLDYGGVFRGQVWRLLTGFLNYGPFGISYLLTTQFVWTYMSAIERLHHDQPTEFFVMMLTGMGSMLVAYFAFGFEPQLLAHNLSTFLVYIWSRIHEGMEVNLMELFNIKAEYLPWFFLLQTFLLEGQLPTLDLLGIVFGHIYYHWSREGVIKTPGWMMDLWEERGGKLKAAYEVIGQDFR
jgi:hypothetical protein